MWLFRRNWVTPKDIAKAEAGNKERERERERERRAVEKRVPLRSRILETDEIEKFKSQI